MWLQVKEGEWRRKQKSLRRRQRGMARKCNANQGELSRDVHSERKKQAKTGRKYIETIQPQGNGWKILFTPCKVQSRCFTLLRVTRIQDRNTRKVLHIKASKAFICPQSRAHRVGASLAYSWIKTFAQLPEDFIYGQIGINQEQWAATVQFCEPFISRKD